MIMLAAGVLLLAGCALVGTEAADETNDDLLVIAHRGASAVEPEHTFLAYDQALDDGADYIEIDLRKTADGELIAMHDDTVDRTTDGEGLVENMTLKELKELDAGEGQSVPSLKEILERYGDSVNYYIETRESDDGELIMEEDLLQLLEQHRIPQNQVILQSFSQASINALHDLDPAITLVQLLKKDKVERLDTDKLQDLQQKAVGVGIYAGILDESLVDLIQVNGLEVHAYYRGDEREWTENMLRYGVDGIFSDDPAYLTNITEKPE
ncbi:glycerophosphodiester phosphodiesterase family protein [Terribacillus sp. DMT04]|uniref:glycerophosphodiester phosphodiesterase family protein n=1 Tax=Terribacillus sp. DMT04 TaxID=2850441 RepID=UPI001C2BF119|nr:glycerophosphodiester phosphodiesterase family protein [Terribacillus sp. DMT04]QXE01897.1 glycerophosphodiester phosphodiesterase [Terribacillus sp. DMT04]